MRLLIVLFVFGAFYCAGQIETQAAKSKDSCYFLMENGKRVKQKRFADWECGKLVGVVDCNEALEYNKNADVVILRTTDLVNSAGGGKPFTGTCESCYYNGKLQRRVRFVNGKQDGIDTTYYKSGCPQVIVSNVNGLESGKQYYFYDSTQYLAWEMSYQLGEKHGTQVYYSKKGDTTKLENYMNGILHGVKKTYYDSSKVKKEVHYFNGIFQGPFILYNRDGQIIEKLNYKEGKKNDECSYFYDNGAPLRTESWKMGEKNGSFKSFYIQGHVLSSENYKKGLKEGIFEDYYPDGKLKRKRVFKKDILIEEYRYDAQGRETYSFGGEEETEAEDDEMPTKEKKKRKKSK